MFTLPQSRNERPAVQRQEQHSKHEVYLFLCSICGSTHYDLILYAQARSRRSGLVARCKTCTASTALFDSESGFI